VDVAFTRARLAVFIDGCFWHGCPQHGTSPKANADWWSDKLTGNRERDLSTTRHLAELGWTVIRIWEHEDPTTAADQISQRLSDLNKPPVPTDTRRSEWADSWLRMGGHEISGSADMTSPGHA
jgi:DNA mismatch endonuclease (patch repair protein)